MINIGLFLLSLSYLLAEYIFNVSIVNVFGSDTAQNYSDVDHVGRLISALGASLLSFRLLINLKIKRKVKIIMILLILPVVGFGVYDLQERLLNYYTKITPMDEKREQAYTYIYKKGISNGSLLNKDLPNDSATTEERMVFNSSLVFWGIGYPEFQNKVLNMSNKEKEKDIELVFRTDFSRNNRYYMTTYRMLDHEIQGLYKGYKFHHERIAEKRRYADREIDKVWDKKLEVEKKLINKYMSVRNSLGKKEEQSLRSGLFRKSIAKELIESYYILAGCSQEACFTGSSNEIKKINNLFKRKNKRARDNGIKVFDHDYTIEKNCSYSHSNGRNRFKVKTLDGHQVDTIDRVSKISRYTNYNTIKCNIDLRPMQHIVITEMYSDLKEKTYMGDFTPRSKKEYTNSKSLSESISYIVFEESGVSLPKNWHTSDKKTFYESFKLHSLGDQYKKLSDRIKEKYGFNVPLHLSKEDFYKNANITKLIKDKSGIYYIDDFNSKGYNNYEVQPWVNFYREKMYTGFKMGMYREEFFKKHYSKHMSVTLARFFDDEINDNEAFVDRTFKVTIVPIIAILFSLFFGLINLAFIFKDIICFLFKVKKSKYKHIVSLSMVIVMILTPYFINNTYTDSLYFQSKVMPSMKDKSLIGAYIYKWFLNTESLVYSTTRHFNIEPDVFLNHYNTFGDDNNLLVKE